MSKHVSPVTRPPVDTAGSRRSVAAAGRARTSAGRRALPGDSPASLATRADPAAVDRVLGDIRHELGNAFHKLYFWVETLRDGGADGGRGETPIAAVDHGLRELDAFLRIAFDHFRPVGLAPTTASVAELLRTVACQLEAAGTRAIVDGAPRSLAGAVARIDPTLLPQMVHRVARRLADPGAVLRLTALRGRVGGRPVVRLAMRAEAEGEAPLGEGVAAKLDRAFVAWGCAMHDGGYREGPGARAELLLPIFTDVRG